jgi:hypothetical protein
LTIWTRRSAASARHRDSYSRRLDEVSHDSEAVKRACFTSLSSMNQRLEALQSNMRAAEHELHTIVEAPQVERREQYEAAAMLLAGGSSAGRVATLLGLPVNQVELVKELQKYAVSGPQAVPVAKAVPPKRRRQRRKPAPPPVRQRPILLTDVVRPSEASSGRKQSAGAA